MCNTITLHIKQQSNRLTTNNSKQLVMASKRPQATSPLFKKDACYHKVKKQYKVFPSAYASGAIAKCRKKNR